MKRHVGFLGNNGVGKYSYTRVLAGQSYKDTTEKNDYFFNIGDNIFIILMDDYYSNRSFKNVYLEKCEIIFLFYDITNKLSFNDLDGYAYIIQDHSPLLKHVILVGTNLDKIENRKINRSDAIDKAAELTKIIFGKDTCHIIETMEISAKNPGCHRSYSLNEFRELIFKRLGEPHENYDTASHIETSNQRHRSSCCHLFLPIIIALLGATGGGVGGYYTGHLIIHHYAKCIIPLFATIGIVVFGTLFGALGYIATHCRSQNDDENKQSTPSISLDKLK